MLIGESALSGSRCEIDNLLRVSMFQTACASRNAFQDLRWMLDDAWSEADHAGHTDTASIPHSKRLLAQVAVQIFP